MSKKKFPYIYRLFGLLFAITLFFSFSGSAPLGNTGAPGDSVCNTCHFGGSQTGNVDILGIIDVDNPIIPGKTYNVEVRIELLSGNSPRAGFEFIALDGNTAVSPSTGTLSNFGTNVGFGTSGNRTYARHVGGENTYTGGIASYFFDWTAPASSNNPISFYAVANIANGSGTSGDLIVFDNDQAIALPVDLTDFKVRDEKNGTVALSWQTASEVNSDFFEVLRSEDGSSFQSLGKIEAAGFSNENQEYSFLDQSPIYNRNSYYRLKQYDYNGDHYFSDIQTIQATEYNNTHLNVFPNPAVRSSCLFIDYFSELAYPDAQMRILDMHGRSVMTNEQLDAGIEKGLTKVVVDINELPVGQYILHITNEGRVLENHMFVVSQ